MLHDHYVIQPGLSVLQVLSNIGINPTSLSYFLLSPDLYTILPRIELILRFPNNILFYEFRIDQRLSSGWIDCENRSSAA